MSLKKGTFSRTLLSCFLALLLILAGLQVVSVSRLLSKTQELLFESADRELDLSIERVDTTLDSIVLKCNTFFQSAGFIKGSYRGARTYTDYECHHLYDLIGTAFNNDQHVQHLVVLLPEQGKVVSDSGVWDWDRYFDRYLHNESYSPSFWRQETEKTFGLRYYPCAVYQEVNASMPHEDHYLLPVAVKPVPDGSVMAIAFCDVP